MEFISLGLGFIIGAVMFTIFDELGHYRWDVKPKGKMFKKSQ